VWKILSFVKGLANERLSVSSAVSEVVATSQEALDSWWGASPDDRAHVLLAVADAIDVAVESLVNVADAETHLGAARLTGEVARTSFQLRMFAHALQQGEILVPSIDPAEPGAPPHGHPELLRTYVPLGVVAVFGASNFPFAFGVLGGDTASALAAGCAVVVKEHPAHPRLSRQLVQLAREAIVGAGAPANLVTSISGLDEGVQLVADSRVKAVGFTGSLAAGRALFDIAAKREVPIPFYGELSSINPVVVTPQAALVRIDDIAAGFVESMTLSAGQFCTKPAVLIAPRSADMTHKVRTLISGLPGMTLLTEEIAARYSQTLAQLEQHPGVSVDKSAVFRDGVVGAAIVEAEIDEFLDPTSPIRRECFGPSAVILPYDDPRRALDAISVDEGILVGCVHGEQDEEIAADFLYALERRAGRVVWNGWPTGVAVTPSQMHGGPWPSSTAPLHTSVGLRATYRFARPVALQDWPDWVPST